MLLDAVWIGIAFLLGLAARQIKLPPLVGYLAAGFVLYAVNINPGEIIEHFADMGVTLLLFSIGLKLRVDTLLRPQVWGVAFTHMGVITLLIGLGLLGLAITSLPLLTELDVTTALLIGFALSYSSTVFAVKVLEEKGELDSIYGRTAIGILIMQDIVAVVFLAISAGKVPSSWALVLFIVVVPARWLLLRFMDRAGHEELLVLFGLSVALGGAQVFDMFNIKGDLGALILGVLLAPHRNASGLAKSLLGFKDLFLVGFFLSIGLRGIPGPESLLIAVLLVAIVPIKSALFFWLLAKFRMRSRTAFLSSLSLSNYSEFGLIIAAIGATNGWISEEWLITIAVALALSFVAASPVNAAAHRLYERYHDWLMRFQHPRRLPEEEEIGTGNATVVVFGMGRIGTQAYDTLRARSTEQVLGIDNAPEVVERHTASGRHVILASATDSDFYSRLQLEHGTLGLILLTMPQSVENATAATMLTNNGYTGRIGALVKYDDEIEMLKEAGVDRVFNLYTEAGAGFATDACRGLIPLTPVLTAESNEPASS
ncbi:MAG: cation:proton antiporter [Rhodothermales bacterium]